MTVLFTWKVHYLLVFFFFLHRISHAAARCRLIFHSVAGWVAHVVDLLISDTVWHFQKRFLYEICELHWNKNTHKLHIIYFIKNTPEIRKELNIQKYFGGGGGMTKGKWGVIVFALSVWNLDLVHNFWVVSNISFD